MTALQAAGLGPNVNLIGPTPEGPLYKPDTELRQQNEVECAFRPDNSEHIFCAYNDYRGSRDPAVGDSWQGVSQSRNGGGTWVSRLSPGWKEYGDQDGDGISESIGREFSADSVVAAVPGMMLLGFIATDRAVKGPGGLYLQRWFETNTEDENGFTWVPEADTLLVAAGDDLNFLDKPDLIFALEEPGPDGLNPTQTITAVLEGGEAITREVPSGTVMMAYTAFKNPSLALIEQDFANGNYAEGQTLDGVADFGGSLAVTGDASQFTYVSDAATLGSTTLSGPVMRIAQNNASTTSLRLPRIPRDLVNFTSEIAIPFELQSTGTDVEGGRYEIDLGFTRITFENEGPVAGRITFQVGGRATEGAAPDTATYSVAINLDQASTLVIRPTFNSQYFGASGRLSGTTFEGIVDAQPASAGESIIRSGTAFGAFAGRDPAQFGATPPAVDGFGFGPGGGFTVELDGEDLGFALFPTPLSGNTPAVGVALPQFTGFPANQPNPDNLAAPFPEITITAQGFPFSRPNALLIGPLRFDGLARASEVLFTKSTSFGDGWTQPRRLDLNAQNASGVHLAYNHSTGNTAAVWRRFADRIGGPGGTAGPGMETSLSGDLGDSWNFLEADLFGVDPADLFGPPVSSICPFDQAALNGQFRTNAFPSLVSIESPPALRAVDTANPGSPGPVIFTGSEEFALLWAQRGLAGQDSIADDCTGGFSRIVFSTLSFTDFDGNPTGLAGGLWRTGFPIDDGTRELAITKPLASTPDAPLGHQTMPQAFRAGGDVYVSWLDSRNDVSGAFGPFIDDQVNPADPQELLRHTMDVRAINFSNVLRRQGNRSSFQVSQYLQGQVDGVLAPLERNYVNARLFKQGTTPFVGDYNSVTGQQFTRTPQGGFSYQGVGADRVQDLGRPFFFAWADNRDVRGDLWGSIDDLTRSEHAPNNVMTSASMEDGPQPAAARKPKEFTEPDPPLPPNEEMSCVDNDSPVRARDQNVYGAMLLPGLDLSTPTPSKPTGNVQRSYPLFVRNFSGAEQDYRLSIVNQPLAGRASFDQFPLPPYDGSEVPPRVEMTLTVRPNMSAGQMVYLHSTEEFAPVEIRVAEIGACETDPNLDCLLDALVLNSNPYAPDLVAPDVANPGYDNDGFGLDPLVAESRQPELGDPIITANFQAPGFQNPGFQNPGIQNIGLQNPGIQNPGIQNPGFQNPGFQNPGLQNPGFQNPGFQNPGFQNPGFQNPGFQNPGFQNASFEFSAIANPGFQNAALTDADMSNITDITWPITNSGNTNAVIDLRPFNNSAVNGALNAPTQLLVTRPQVQPTIRDCVYVSEVRQQVLVNIANPDFSGVYDPAAQTGGEFGSVVVGPYETLFVTVRIFAQTQPEELEAFGVMAVNQACDSTDAGCTADPSTRAMRVDQIGAVDPEPQVWETVPKVAAVVGRVYRPFWFKFFPSLSKTYIGQFRVINRTRATVEGPLRLVSGPEHPFQEPDGVTAAGETFLNLPGDLARREKLEIYAKFERNGKRRKPKARVERLVTSE